MPNEKILIDLTKPLAARSVLPGEMIQLDALDRMVTIIERQLKLVTKGLLKEPRPSGIVIPRRHNAIAITGGRGTGKSTFMLSLKERISVDPRLKSRKLEWLRPIDPTLIENKENILVTILAQMWSSIPHDIASKSSSYTKWDESYRALAEGLQVLEGIGRSDDAEWESPQYAMERGINRANCGVHLEESFHTFVDRTLDLLDQDAFVITLDDIDTQFDRGWLVLEVVRKYLTSPRLIVLVLGDLHLYSLLVRREHWKTMAGNTPFERSEWPEVPEAVRRLESQYLEKILKIENRIKLQSLDEVVQRGHDVEVVCRRDEGEAATEPLPLGNLIKTLCTHALSLQDPRDLALVQHLLLRQPVRTVLHLLTGRIHKWNPAEVESASPQDIRQVLDLLAESSLGALYKHGVRVDDLRSATADGVMELAIDFLRVSDLWHDGYRLKPEFRDDWINMALLALGSRITYFQKESPQLIGDYMIRIGITREAGMLQDTKRYIDFVGLETTKSLPTIARRAIGYLRSVGNGEVDQTGPSLGSIATVTHMTAREMSAYVKKLSKAKTACSHYDIYKGTVGPAGATRPALVNTIGSLLGRISGFDGTMAALPTLRLTNAVGRSTTYLSIFPLIAIVSELLDRNVTQHLQEFRRWGQLRSFSVYCEPAQYGKLVRGPGRAEGSSSGLIVEQERMAKTEPAAFGDGHPLLNHIKAWIDWAHGPWAKERWEPLPSHVLGDIWARFYHSIERVDETPTEEWHSGNLLHRYIVAFLNAVLVEEHLARVHPGEIRLQSPSRSDYSFMVNLELYEEAPRQNGVSQKYPWFDLFFRCPLWAAYLRPPREGEKGGVWQRQVKAWCGDGSERDALSVRYMIDLNDPERTVSFANLYAIYDSIPVQTAPVAKATRV